MAICNFFLKGQCRFGDKCRNEHPAGGQVGGAFGNQSWNNPSRGGPSNTTTSNNSTTPLFTVDSMKNDLTPNQDKPLWPLSSYGAAKYETNLISGLDESYEELRVKAVTAMTAGNVNQYMQYEADKISQADKQFNDARNNIQQAYDQATKQNGVTSMLNNAITASSTNTSGAFGGSGPAFGSSSFGSSTNAFGAQSSGAFGQPAQPSSAFGQPSQPTSAFGQSTFGQTSQPTSAFGQPVQPASAFGQTSQPTSSLIKPATAGAFGAFAAGGPSAFGAGATPAPAASNPGGGFAAFANPSGQTSAFGAPAPAAQPSAFGSSATTTTPSPFGSSGSFTLNNTSNNTTSSVFGTPSAGTNAFGAAAPSGAFGSLAPPTTSAFGSAPAPTSVFGSTPNAPAQTTSSVFGALPPVQSAFGNNTASVPSAFGSTATPSAFGAPSAFGGGNVGGFGSSTPAKPVSTVPDFKAGLTGSYVAGKTPYDQTLPKNYLSEVIPKNILDLFKAEQFEWGKVPDWIPPLELR